MWMTEGPLSFNHLSEFGTGIGLRDAWEISNVCWHSKVKPKLNCSFCSYTCCCCCWLLCCWSLRRNNKLNLDPSYYYFAALNSNQRLKTQQVGGRQQQQQHLSNSSSSQQVMSRAMDLPYFASMVERWPACSVGCNRCCCYFWGKVEIWLVAANAG